jgi:hypothetical protein
MVGMNRIGGLKRFQFSNGSSLLKGGLKYGTGRFDTY